MAKKTELVVNKMYVWDIEVDGKDYEWKCFVGIDECITYGNGKELQRLKIENMNQQRGVLQIDTQVQVGDETVPFQLENGVPYIKLLEDDGERRWIKSDTTMEDNLRTRVDRVKKEAFTMGGLAILMALICLVDFLINGELSEMNFAHIFGVICLLASGLNLVKLRDELHAMGRKFNLEPLEESK